MPAERLTLEGHLFDENMLAKVFSTLDRYGVAFRVRRFKVGEASHDPSLMELLITADNPVSLHEAIEACRPFGANVDDLDATLIEADMDGVLPEDFYSTTNFTTFVRADGDWIEVERLEMDCGIRVWNDGRRNRAETCPMHRVKRGDRIVVGFDGVKVLPMPDESMDAEEFRFMSNEVSSERPKARMIRHCADAMRMARRLRRDILFVGGPAIVHSGSADRLAWLIENRWVTVLFAGNALAAHDIEAAMLSTSLGVDLDYGESRPHGHTHHLRAINRVRRAGSIRAVVDSGLVRSGVMHACVTHDVPFVLAGSIRDDGPLPDVITDNVRAQDVMREHVDNVGVAIMVATTLHSVATGNILPASVKTYCVDSDADTVIKLTDRGTHQAIGLVTDCEYFLGELCRLLRE
jgi:lysine-ketoglutarate reductase/saccharopine dehydrogenase-like protein (TIGR00300 family)